MGGNTNKRLQHEDGGFNLKDAFISEKRNRACNLVKLSNRMSKILQELNNFFIYFLTLSHLL